MVGSIIGTGLGLGIIGEGLSEVDPNISSAMLEAGSAATKFIPPAINIQMGGHMVRQLKTLRGKDAKKNNRGI